MDDVARSRLGRTLRGKYQLDSVLGVGGMAAVYAATHRNRKQFAIKMLHPDLSNSEQVRTRFLREGYVANSVNHPGAVAVLDDDVAEDGSAFLVMELLDGLSVEQLWERRGYSLSIPMVLALADQLLDVLAAAHRNGVIHRDLKPANVFVTRDGSVKVLDFGIARLRDAQNGKATTTGSMLGTPAFMPPEQALGKMDELDAQTDLWAVGASLFTLISGEFVHEGSNSNQLVLNAATRPARSLQSVVLGVPASVSRVVDRALSFDKKHRWLSASEMQRAVRDSHVEAFGKPISARVLALGEEVGATERARVDADAYAPAGARVPASDAADRGAERASDGSVGQVGAAQHGVAARHGVAAQHEAVVQHRAGVQQGMGAQPGIGAHAGAVQHGVAVQHEVAAQPRSAVQHGVGVQHGVSTPRGVTPEYGMAAQNGAAVEGGAALHGVSAQRDVPANHGVAAQPPAAAAGRSGVAAQFAAGAQPAAAAFVEVNIASPPVSPIARFTWPVIALLAIALAGAALLQWTANERERDSPVHQLRAAPDPLPAASPSPTTAQAEPAGAVPSTETPVVTAPRTSPIGSNAGGFVDDQAVTAPGTAPVGSSSDSSAADKRAVTTQGTTPVGAHTDKQAPAAARTAPIGANIDSSADKRAVSAARTPPVGSTPHPLLDAPSRPNTAASLRATPRPATAPHEPEPLSPVCARLLERQSLGETLTAAERSLFSQRCRR